MQCPAGRTRLHHENGMTPLASAAFHGKPSLIALFLEQKSDLKKTNRDGNTTLHIAAFMCRTEVVKLLLKNGASLTARNHRRETPLDVVSGDWSEPLAGLYQFLNTSAELKLDLAGIQKQRTQVVDLLHKHMTK
ncbi:ankyrin repeat domain-containing protein [Akkermansiaceae bacterium]|nr:ankyrin repeat domain-containing protein [Akkermansiaceae bacterium]